MNFLTRSDAKITLGIIAINVLVWVGQMLPGSNLTFQLLFSPISVFTEPWRMITAGFAHNTSDPLHLLLNMYSLYIFGSVLEPALGRARFISVYLLSIFGGSVAVMYLNTPDSLVLGASGGVFGLMAAYFVVLRTLGTNARGMLGLIGINLVFGFFVQGVSWQAHLGGLLAGGALTSVYANTRGRSQKAAQLVGAISVVIVFVGLTYWRMQTMFA